MGETGILNFTLSSDGSKEADEVDGYIRVEGSTIEDVRIMPEILHAEKIVKGDTISLKVKTLNPSEYLQVSALVRKNTGLPTRPIVDFRGKGVVAEERTALPSRDFTGPFVVLTIIYAASLAGLYNKFMKADKENLKNFKLSTDTIEAKFDETLLSIKETYLRGTNEITENYKHQIDKMIKETKSESERNENEHRHYSNLLKECELQTNEAIEAHRETLGIRGDLMARKKMDQETIETLKETIVTLKKTIEDKEKTIKRRGRNNPPATN
jgi:hypothetical protein